MKPEVNRLRELLTYDPVTGVFTWKCQRGRISAGTVCGYITSEGYRHIKIDGTDYGAHRLAWAYVHGEWPDRIVDHRNRINDDNRIENLRLATDQQSAWNRTSKNKHGAVKGVSKKRGLWRAQIYWEGKNRHIGYYDSKEKANEAYIEKSKELHGEFSYA